MDKSLKFDPGIRPYIRPKWTQSGIVESDLGLDDPMGTITLPKTNIAMENPPF